MSAWRERRRQIEGQRLDSTPKGPRPPRLAPLSRGAGKHINRALKLLGLWGPGTRRARNLRHRALTISLPTLPAAFQGYSILHLSDPHPDTLDGIDTAIVAIIEGLTPDLMVMTGDYVTFHPWSRPRIETAYKRILGAVAPADGVLATLGNHDDLAVADLPHDLGVRVLANETLDLARDGERLRIVGIDDPHRYFTEAAGELLARRQEGFSLVLVHTPEVADTAAAAGHDLYLCGHTHWGQVCLPRGIPVVTALHANRALAQGSWRRGDMLGYTHAGCGVARVPVRFFTRGEVVSITLRRAPAEIVTRESGATGS